MSYRILFRSVGEALVAHGMRGLLGLVPFGQVLYDVARKPCGWRFLPIHSLSDPLDECGAKNIR